MLRDTCGTPRGCVLRRSCILNAHRLRRAGISGGRGLAMHGEMRKTRESRCWLGGIRATNSPSSSTFERGSAYPVARSCESDRRRRDWLVARQLRLYLNFNDTRCARAAASSELFFIFARRKMQAQDGGSGERRK